MSSPIAALCAMPTPSSVRVGPRYFSVVAMVHNFPHWLTELRSPFYDRWCGRQRGYMRYLRSDVGVSLLTADCITNSRALTIIASLRHAPSRYLSSVLTLAPLTNHRRPQCNLRRLHHWHWPRNRSRLLLRWFLQLLRYPRLPSRRRLHLPHC